MMTSMYSSRSTHGFTLVELVVAIVISAIVAVFIGIFITTPIDNYFAQSRRAELIVESDLIQRNMDHDIRNAVPNSIRRINTGSVKVLELLYAVDMARYRAENTSLPKPVAADELSFTSPDPGFSTLGQFNRSTTGNYLVINQNQVSGQDAYNGDKSITPYGTIIKISNPKGKGNKTDNVTMMPAFQFASASPTGSVFLVSGPVAYVCDENNHTLVRFAGYSISSTIAGNRGSASSVGTISLDISSCNFNFSASTSSRTDLVSATIQLLRSGETMPVFIQSAVDNMP